MCTQKAPNDYSQELYDRYRKVFEDYLTQRVSECVRAVIYIDSYVLVKLSKQFNMCFC